MSKAKNVFIAATGDTLKRLEEEYALIGRSTKRTEGGLILLAYTPKKPKKKVEAKKRREGDEEKVKPTREQRSKSRS